jgi:hypothetical protein
MAEDTVGCCARGCRQNCLDEAASIEECHLAQAVVLPGVFSFKTSILDLQAKLNGSWPARVGHRTETTCKRT